MDTVYVHRSECSNTGVYIESVLKIGLFNLSGTGLRMFYFTSRHNNYHNNTSLGERERERR